MSNVEAATAGADDGPAVDASNRSTMPDIDVERWATVAAETLAAEQVRKGHLDLTFVDPDEMTELNRVHMGHDGPTDVLSFPLDTDDLGTDRQPAVGAGAGDVTEPPVLLGDIVICPQVAVDQAPDHCGDPEAEFTLLVVHGVLHILGHDHAEPDDEAVMIEHETGHLQRYGLRHPGPVGPGRAP